MKAYACACNIIMQPARELGVIHGDTEKHDLIGTQHNLQAIQMSNDKLSFVNAHRV